MDSQPKESTTTASLPERESFGGKIAAILLRRNMIDMRALQQASADIQADGRRLEEYLLERGMVSDIDLALVTAEYLGLSPISLVHFTPDSQLLDLLPSTARSRLLAVPIARSGKNLTVAVGDPFNMAILDEIQTATGLKVTPVVATEREVREVLLKYVEQSVTDLEDTFKDLIEGEEVELGHDKKEEVSLDQMLESAEGAPVIRIVNSILLEAMRRRASDIHIEPMERQLRLRYRLDGDLYEMSNPPKVLQSAIISRIKIMSDMDIAERRVPQDGRFKIRALGREVDVRGNLLPMIHGEKIVMRILDKSSLAPSLSALGLD
ncbi:MAG: Flp pilus assembly complex ATPase component TadA, partial [Clostridiales bacterium]|nr:Flp pilus assembly complex ATPase component TadA [Clostridiales bacterium]